MKVAVIGVGCIGSVVAAHMVEAGHDVTLVARGRRAEVLAAEGLRLRRYGSRSERVHRLPVVATVDEAKDAELLVVTVQMHQVEAILSGMGRHPAARVCFLMNVHPVPEAWVQVLGERLVLGFPAMLAGYRRGCVVYQTLPSWMRFAMISTLGPARGGDVAPARELVRLFADAGLAATSDPDMESWLASHSALMTPVMALAVQRIERKQPLVMSWADASAVGHALHESLRLARQAGARLTPSNVAALRAVPVIAIASSMWAVSRVPLFRRAVHDYAEHARDEVWAMYSGLKRAASDAGAPALDSLCLALGEPRGLSEELVA